MFKDNGHSRLERQEAKVPTKKNPEGNIPIEDTPKWIKEFKAIRMGNKKIAEFIRHHYFEAVRHAKQSGETYDSFIENLIKDIRQNFSATTQADEDETREIILKIWNKEEN